MGEQLSLEVEKPLLIVARRADGTVVDVIPVDGHTTFGAAVLWAYVALRAAEKRSQ